MASTSSWVALGSDGLSRLQTQLEALGNLQSVAFDSRGNSYVEHEWKVVLAEQILENLNRGALYAVTAFGPNFTSLDSISSAEFAQAVETTLDRFFATQGKFAVIPSDFLYGEAPDFGGSAAEDPEYFKLFSYRSAVYGLLRLEGDSLANRVRFDRTLPLVSTGAIPIAIRGDEGFDAICEELWQAGRGDDESMSTLAQKATAMLLSGPICGEYLVWAVEQMDA